MTMTLTVLASVSLLVLVSTAHPVPLPINGTTTFDATTSNPPSDEKGRITLSDVGPAEVHSAVHAILESHAGTLSIAIPPRPSDVHVHVTTPDDQLEFLERIGSPGDVDSAGAEIKGLVHLGGDGPHSADEQDWLDILTRLERTGHISSSGNDLQLPPPAKGGDDLEMDREIADGWELMTGPLAADLSEELDGLTRPSGDWIDAGHHLPSSHHILILVFSCVAALLLLGCVAMVLFMARILRRQTLEAKCGWDFLPKLKFWGQSTDEAEQMEGGQITGGPRIDPSRGIGRGKPNRGPERIGPKPPTVLIEDPKRANQQDTVTALHVAVPQPPRPASPLPPSLSMLFMPHADPLEKVKVTPLNFEELSEKLLSEKPWLDRDNKVFPFPGEPDRGESGLPDELPSPIPDLGSSDPPIYSVADDEDCTDETFHDALSRFPSTYTTPMIAPIPLPLDINEDGMDCAYNRTETLLPPAYSAVMTTAKASPSERSPGSSLRFRGSLAATDASTESLDDAPRNGKERDPVVVENSLGGTAKVQGRTYGVGEGLRTVEAALALQLRPLFGVVGPDAAWLVRFVMALFGWGRK